MNRGSRIKWFWCGKKSKSNILFSVRTEVLTMRGENRLEIRISRLRVRLKS